MRGMDATRTMRTVITAGFTTLVLAACGGDGGPGPNPPPGVISLNVGEGRTLTAAQAATIEISGGSGAEFVLIPFYASQTPTATVSLDFASTQITGVSGPPLPQVAPATSGGLSLERPTSLASAIARARFDGDLRRLERDVFARRIPAARAARALRASASGSYTQQTRPTARGV
jgi:hypothetical protein